MIKLIETPDLKEYIYNLFMKDLIDLTIFFWFWLVIGTLILILGPWLLLLVIVLSPVLLVITLILKLFCSSKKE